MRLPRLLRPASGRQVDDRMSAGTTGKAVANPCCTTDADLPPPPSIGELRDPAEPHPDEPGAPADSPELISVTPDDSDRIAGERVESI